MYTVHNGDSGILVCKMYTVYVLLYIVCIHVCLFSVCNYVLIVFFFLFYSFQVSENLCLHFYVNSVRRAHWSATLGKVCLKHPPIFPLASILPQGGMISCVEVSLAHNSSLTFKFDMKF